MRYSIEPRDGIIVKGYEFLSFAKNMSENIGQNCVKKTNSNINRNNW